MITRNTTRVNMTCSVITTKWSRNRAANVGVREVTARRVAGVEGRRRDLEGKGGK